MNTLLSFLTLFIGVAIARVPTSSPTFINVPILFGVTPLTDNSFSNSIKSKNIAVVMLPTSLSLTNNVAIISQNSLENELVGFKVHSNVGLFYLDRAASGKTIQREFNSNEKPQVNIYENGNLLIKVLPSNLTSNYIAGILRFLYSPPSLPPLKYP